MPDIFEGGVAGKLVSWPVRLIVGTAGAATGVCESWEWVGIAGSEGLRN